MGNMEAEYKQIIFNIGIKPSPKSIMVSIPMYMYRIETNEFTYGLNFFQKTVLKFKSKPGIKSEKIAQLLGLDPKLIESVASELMVKGLLNEYGSLSDKGKEKLNEVDGLVINSGKRKLGYVFKYVNQDKLYQYFVSHITYADVIEEGKKSFPKVVTGTKGEGVDYCITPLFLDDLFRTQINVPKPAEKEILTLIQNADKKRISTGVNETSERISALLGVRFINEQPLMVWVCTYIYLHQTEDNFFEPDWRVLDPFGFGDNVALKFYLNSPA
ncbi:MAG TPA: hypothetical protein DCQ50_17665, partial [Chryseobacterium sp.]|nr:hypothetical protein [Chryseobacterium sp.]